IYSTVPLDCPIGDTLGNWEFEKYENGKFLLPGIYQVDETLRTRGYPKGEKFNFPDIYDKVIRGKVPLVNDRMFIGVRRSLKMYKKFPVCGFYDFPKTVDWNSPKRVWLGRDSSCAPNIYQERSKPFDPFNKKLDEQGLLDAFESEYDE